jgi:hypothetical protein
VATAAAGGGHIEHDGDGGDDALDDQGASAEAPEPDTADAEATT